MTIKATKFTPEVLLSAPRRSPGIPNSDGRRVLYSVSSYSFHDHKQTKEIRVLDTEINESHLVTDNADASEPQWFDDELILLLEAGEKGATKVVIGPPGHFEKTKYTAGVIDASISQVKLKKVGDGLHIFACAALTKPDGSLYNAETAKKPHSTGQLYSSVFVRHWDHYVTPNRNSIWYGTLVLCPDQYKLSPLTNALKGTGLSSPIDQATGGGVNFDIGRHGLVFVAKDPNMNPSTNTKQNLYIITSDGSSHPRKPVQVVVPGYEGACSNTVLSPDGVSLAFTSKLRNGSEADKNQLFVIPDIRESSQRAEFYATDDGLGSWDRSIDSIVWSRDGRTLYVVAEDEGAGAVYRFLANPEGLIRTPEQIMRQGSVSDVQALDDGRLFVSGSSFVDSSAYYILDHNRPRLVSSISHGGVRFGLSSDQVSEIRFQGAETEIQAYVLKPSTFDAEKKYPVAFIIHGGPEGAWLDGWSTRWNLAVFAEQGYIVVAPNPTGSTGFGQKLTDAIRENWGGSPYEDIVKCFDYVGENFEYADMSRAVALGASYGGYMMNWIQGQPLGRKFKAIVTHDGTFGVDGKLATDELWFPEAEFGGKYWENREGWTKWDPLEFVENWATPHLIIHSEKDYRVLITDGLSAFNVLQEKGIDSKFLVFPDENHWVLKPENSLLWHTVVLSFINFYVGLPKYGERGYPAQLLKDADMSV